MSNIGYRVAVAVLVAGVVGGFGSGIMSCGRHHREYARGEACEGRHNNWKKGEDEKKPDAPKPAETAPSTTTETPAPTAPTEPTPPQE